MNRSQVQEINTLQEQNKLGRVRTPTDKYNENLKLIRKLEHKQKDLEYWNI